MTSIISVLTKIPNLYKELTKFLPNTKFHEVTSPDNDPQFRESKIIIGDYNLFGPYLYDLPNTKWIQATWAGIDYLLPHIRDNKPFPMTITRFTGQHMGRLMGEYVIANIINYERNFFEGKNSQKSHTWLEDGKIRYYRSVFDLTIGILGLGKIGSQIGEMLNFMGAKVIGYGRKPKPDNQQDYLSGFSTNLPELLGLCDYVVSVLPNTKETTNILGNDVLKNCETRETLLINIGRSNVISEDDLLKALNNKWISGAILDVFNEEPLKSNSPLWDLPQVFITPHVAGNSRAKDIVEQFRENLELFEKNLPLPAIINLEKGY